MISCREADFLAMALSIGSASQADESALHDHVQTCSDCRHLARQYMESAPHLFVALDPIEPPPQLRTRLLRAVYAEAAGQRRPAEGSAASRWLRRIWARVPACRGFTVVAAAASVAAVATASLAGIPRSIPSSAQVVVEMSATLSAPDARGQLRYDYRDQLAALMVTGLPVLDRVAEPDAVYEVWLIRPRSAPVPVAFLNRAPDGNWSAVVRADVGAYSTLSATLERHGGSVTPDGPEVLQGSLAGV